MDVEGSYLCELCKVHTKIVRDCRMCFKDVLFDLYRSVVANVRVALPLSRLSRAPLIALSATRKLEMVPVLYESHRCICICIV